MPRIGYAVTALERAFFEEYGRRKGLSVSSLAKSALFAYVARYPVKGLAFPESPPAVQQQATRPEKTTYPEPTE